MNCSAPPVQAGKPMPKIEPMLASCTVVSTPSLRQRAVSTAWRYSRRSFTSCRFPGDAGLLEQGLELGPQASFLARRVVVEAAAGGAAGGLNSLTMRSTSNSPGVAV
jgi:hypothetical protein